MFLKYVFVCASDAYCLLGFAAPHLLGLFKAKAVVDTLFFYSRHIIKSVKEKKKPKHDMSRACVCAPPGSPGPAARLPLSHSWGDPCAWWRRGRQAPGEGSC